MCVCVCVWVRLVPGGFGVGQSTTDGGSNNNKPQQHPNGGILFRSFCFVSFRFVSFRLLLIGRCCLFVCVPSILLFNNVCAFFGGWGVV